MSAVPGIRAFYVRANDIGGDPERSNAQIARHWLEASERHGMPVRTEGFRLFTAESREPVCSISTGHLQVFADRMFGGAIVQLANELRHIQPNFAGKFDQHFAASSLACFGWLPQPCTSFCIQKNKKLL